ncbi:MAG: dTDP-4-dehydrorhamnose reductase [Devosia sp.]
MKLLLLGKDGQVGRALQQALPPLGALTAHGRDTADLMHPAAIAALIARERPDVVVNAAAYTAVDAAEDDRQAAWTVNAEAVEAIGRAARQNGALVIHYSTDYVFDGSAPEPYREDAATSPLGVYGASKLAGEVLLRDSGATHAIVRTSWVYAPVGKNFALTMLRLARERETLDVVADQVGAATPAALIAEVTARLIPALRSGTPGGVYHLAPTGETSWHGYAQFLVTEALAAGVSLKLTPEAIRAIPASAYPTRAQRPANSRLDTAKLRETFGMTLPPWQEPVRQLIRMLKAEGRL